MPHQLVYMAIPPMKVVGKGAMGDRGLVSTIFLKSLSLLYVGGFSAIVTNLRRLLASSPPGNGALGAQKRNENANGQIEGSQSCAWGRRQEKHLVHRNLVSLLKIRLHIIPMTRGSQSVQGD